MGGVTDGDRLARPGEVYFVVTDHIPHAQRMHANLTLRSRSGLAVSSMYSRSARASRLRRFEKRNGPAAQCVRIPTMMCLDDL